MDAASASASASAAAATPLEGNVIQRWDRFRKIAKLGHGAYGMVYLAEVRKHPNPTVASTTTTTALTPSQGQPQSSLVLPLNKKVAIKCVMVKNLPEKDVKIAANEVSVLSRLNHPNIITYYEYHLDDEGFLNIVMEYASEGDLAALIRRHKESSLRMDEHQIMDLTFQLLSALSFLRSLKVIHRHVSDLKPANCFLVGNGNIKIGDFGISKVVSTTSMYALTFLGTPNYIAPELMAGEPYSFGADMWALGCIVYELAALHPPFEAGNFLALVLLITNGKYEPLPNQYSPVLSQLVASLLCLNQHMRLGAEAALATFFPAGLGTLGEIERLERQERVLLREAEATARHNDLQIYFEELVRQKALEDASAPHGTNSDSATIADEPSRSSPIPFVPLALPSIESQLSWQEKAAWRELKIREKCRLANERRHLKTQQQLHQQPNTQTPATSSSSSSSTSTPSLPQGRDVAQDRAEERADQLMVQQTRAETVDVHQDAYFNLLQQRMNSEQQLLRQHQALMGLSDQLPVDADDLEATEEHEEGEEDEEEGEAEGSDASVLGGDRLIATVRNTIRELAAKSVSAHWRASSDGRNAKEEEDGEVNGKVDDDDDEEEEEEEEEEEDGNVDSEENDDD